MLTVAKFLAAVPPPHPAPTHPAHVAATSAAAAGGVTLSIALVAAVLGYWAATSGRHWALAAVCWITVGASGLAFAGTIAGLFTSVVTGIVHAVNGVASQ
jgi:hypothetical protein